MKTDWKLPCEPELFYLREKVKRLESELAYYGREHNALAHKLLDTIKEV
jgi:hypothetical protein